MVVTVGGGTITRSLEFENSFSWMIALPFVWLISSIAYGPRWLSGRRSWAWTAYFAIILLVAFAVPIYLWVDWVFGIGR